MTAWLPTALEPAASVLGWALLHFLWQGAAVALLVALVLAFVGRNRPAVAYGVCCAALGLLLCVFVATLVIVSGRAAPGIDGMQSALSDTVRRMGLGGHDPYGGIAPIVAVAWLAGLGLMQVRLAMQLFVAHELRRKGLLPLPGEWTAVIADLGRRVGLRRPVAAFASRRAAVPMVVGWLKPVVLVPVRALTGLGPVELRAILAHELAHVRRNDALVNLAQVAVETLFFFHPAVWWLSGRIRVERECCCDDVAVTTCGDPLTFAKALVSLDALQQERSLALAATGGSLMQRISRLLGARKECARDPGSWLLPGLVLMAVVFAAPVIAQGFAGAGQDEAAVHVDDAFISELLLSDPELAMTLAQMRTEGLSDELIVLLVRDAIPVDGFVDASLQGAEDAALLKRRAEQEVAASSPQAHGAHPKAHEARKRKATAELELHAVEAQAKAGAEAGAEAGASVNGRVNKPFGPKAQAELDETALLTRATIERQAHLKKMLVEVKQQVADGRIDASEGKARAAKIEFEMVTLAEQLALIMRGAPAEEFRLAAERAANGETATKIAAERYRLHFKGGLHAAGSRLKKAVAEGVITAEGAERVLRLLERTRSAFLEGTAR